MNVTVSLSDHLVREARHEAVDRGVSLSRYVAMVLEEKLAVRQRYQRALEEDKRARQRGLFGLPDGITWTRDELHER